MDAFLRHATDVLRAAGIGTPAREARLLASHALGREASLVDPATPVDAEALLARRAAREPLAYITGRAGFWTLDLAVSPATLIPRADSETLITAALAARPALEVARVLDLGTGTGALLLAALAVFPDATGIGVDRSPSAARLARDNAAANGFLGRACFVVGDWANALDGQFDLVLCNPPYIRAGDLPGLMPEVASYEPQGALDGGPDGLDAYRVLFPALIRLLTADGLAIFEVGADTAAEAGSLARSGGWPATLVPDLAGQPRALCLDRRQALANRPPVDT